MSVALIDADIVCYRAAVIGEEDDPFGEPGELVYDLTKACEAADRLIREWTKEADCKAAICVFSGPDNFRYEVLPSYKSNRTGEKPRLYFDVKAHIERHWRTIEKPRLEADDTMGIIGTKDPARYVVVSADKDMQTLPCRVLIPGKMPIPKLIKPRDADRFWMTQALTGDPVDGYKGCPKVGPVKAAKILSGITRLPAMWEAVKAAFEAAGKTAADALKQARVARILRVTDFDTETREIILWTPKSKEPLRLQTEGR